MPACATCEEYISPDFVRVFGDNNRVVTACLSCRGKSPEPDKPAEATEAPESVAAEPELAVAEVSYDVADADEFETEAVEPSEYEQPTFGHDVGAAEPETVAAPAGGSSAFGFLRSVFSR